MLTGQLVRRVGRQRCLRRILVDGLPFAIIAVNRRTGGEDHPAHTSLTHGLAEIQRADQVALVRTDRIFHRRLHGRHRGQVHHRRTSLDRTMHGLRIGDVTLDQLEAITDWQVAALARGEIIQHPHRVAACDKGVDQIGADEAGATGNQNQ